MGEADQRQAEERIDTAEKRLAALQDLGIDTAALRSRVAFARTCLLEGNIADVNSLCDEVLSAARRLADGAGPAAEAKPRTGRFSRDQLGEEVRALLDQGLLAKLLAEHQAGPDPRLEARLLTLENRVSSQLAGALAALAQAQASAQGDLATLRAELKHGLDIIGSLRQSAAAPPADGPAAAAVLERFAAQLSEHQERLIATIAAGVERLAQPPAASAAGGPMAAGEPSAGGTESTQVLKRFAAESAVQQERLLSALANSMAQFSEVVARHPAMAQPEAASPAADPGLTAALERISGAAGAQQERLLAALASGMEQLGAMVRQAAIGSPGADSEAMAETLRWGCERISAAISVGPTVGVPAAGGGEMAGQLIERFAAQSAEQQERLLGALSSGIERLAAALSTRAAEAGPPAGELAGVVREGFVRLSEALVQRGSAPSQQLTTADLAALVPGPPGPPGSVLEHETTRFFQSVSTRTDKPAVRAAGDQPPARPDALIDTGRVRQLVADEVGQQFTDRQGSNEPVTIYDPEQVRLQVVSEVSRLLAERPAGGPAAAPALKEAELGKLLVLMLPGVLAEEPVRRALFSLICLEAVSNPGALGELSGLRSFLRRELALAAEDLAHDAQPA